MKTLFKILIGLGIGTAGLGAGIYYFGTKAVSDKVMEEVAVQLEKTGEMNQLKKHITDDPDLQSFVAEGASADSSNLPFQTKEEAVRKLVQTFNVSELEKIQSSLQGGLTDENKQELLQTLESKLTEEELLALKVIAYKELNK